MDLYIHAKCTHSSLKSSNLEFFSRGLLRDFMQRPSQAMFRTVAFRNDSRFVHNSISERPIPTRTLRIDTGYFPSLRQYMIAACNDWHTSIASTAELNSRQSAKQSFEVQFQGQSRNQPAPTREFSLQENELRTFPLTAKPLQLKAVRFRAQC